MNTFYLVDHASGAKLGLFYCNVVPRTGEFIIAGKKGVYVVKFVVFGDSNAHCFLVVEPGHPETVMNFGP